MTTSPGGRETRAAVKADLDVMSKAGHFHKTLEKGPKTTTWIWNLHALAHDFDTHKNTNLEDISRKVFSAHFGHLAVIFVWLSGSFYHGARFSNYEAWLANPTGIKPGAQVVWPIVGQDILNADLGGGYHGIQITSGFFQIWRAWGVTSSYELTCLAIGALVMAGLVFHGGFFHYHKAAPSLEWFQNVEAMMNHHLAVLLGCGSLGWAGHLIHVSLPVNTMLDSGITDIPLARSYVMDKAFMADMYPSFAQGVGPFFTLNWGVYSDFLTFKGGLNPTTGGLWLTDVIHHHLALGVLLIVAGHMYRTNWGIGHSMKEILEGHKGPFTGSGHKGLYEVMTTSWHAQLAVNLALLGSLSIVVAQHMY
ncbi:MAG: photosystem I core protein PsaA, partial [Thermosynechococcaceae cyanobacterium]